MQIALIELALAGRIERHGHQLVSLKPEREHRPVRGQRRCTAGRMTRLAQLRRLCSTASPWATLEKPHQRRQSACAAISLSSSSMSAT